MMRKALVGLAIVASGFAGAAVAKLPVSPPTPEQQAKAAEAKAKAEEAAKKEADQLSKAQDRAADNFRKGKGRMVAVAKK